MPGLERVTFQHLDTVQDRKDIFLIGRTIEGKSVAVKITDVRPHVCIEYEGERENVGSFIKILSQKVYEYECHTKILENIDKKKYTFPNTEQLSASDVPKDYITGEVFKGQNIVKYDESGAKLFLRIFSKDRYVLKYVKTFLSSTEIQMVKTIVYVSADSKTMNVPLHMSSLPKTYKGYELFVEKTTMVPTMGKHTLFNDHVDFTLQYLIDKDIYSCGFIEVEGFEKEKETTCDVELIAQSVRQVKVEGMAPWRILSYDIESVPREIVGRKNKYLFPVAEKDPICTIGVTLQISADVRTYAWILVGPGEDKKATLSLDALESPPDEYRPEKTTVYFHTDELEMIEDFVAFIIGKDVDFIEGHNINRFDNVYLLERYNVLKGGGKVEKFPIMGRLKRRVSRISVKTFNSNQKGSHEKYSLLLPGRVILDSYDIMKDQHNESSYKLDSLAEKYLGTKKIDQDYNTINPMWKSERGRHDLAVYCVKDSWLVRKMMDKLCKLTVLLQMSNVTGISMKDVIERGQGIRTIGLMLRYAMKRKDKQDKCEYLIPRLVKEVEMIKKKKYNFSTNKVEYVEYEKDPESFEGAIVVPPNTGFYKNAVSCLDFASLYPSIMRALNMSYETLVCVETVQKMGWKELEGKEEAVGVRTIPDFTYENMELKVVKDQTKSPIFVSASTRKGLLPEMLESVLSERKSVKKQMKALKDPSCDMYKVLDGRQLGLKVVANSMYGFTGATTGFLPEKRIASSVTKYGRYMITQTKAKVENHPVWGRGGHHATCIYGDTDSVFIHMPRSLVNGANENELMANAHRIGEEMASYITNIFLPPNELEYEKSYSSFLLLCKKRYAGHKFEPGHKPSLQIKGLEAARRDYAPLLVETQKTMLNILLLERNVQKACDYVADTVYKLMNNQIPLEKFIMSKKLSKAPGDYNAPAAHVNLALRLTKENPDQAPVAGDRVDFVIFNSSSPKVSHSACLPSEIMSEKYTINVNYYLDKQLRGPLLRILEKVVDNPRDLFKCTSIFKARGINAYFKASEEGSSSKKRKENRRVLGFPKRVKVKETNPHRKVQTLDSMFKR